MPRAASVASFGLLALVAGAGACPTDTCAAGDDAAALAEAGEEVELLEVSMLQKSSGLVPSSQFRADAPNIGQADAVNASEVRSTPRTAGQETYRSPMTMRATIATTMLKMSPTDRWTPAEGITGAAWPGGFLGALRRRRDLKDRLFVPKAALTKEASSAFAASIARAGPSFFFIVAPVLGVALVTLRLAADVWLAGGDSAHDPAPKTEEELRWSRRKIQIVLAALDFLFMAAITVVIPESYELMRVLGHGATASGWLIGLAWASEGFVAILAGRLATVLSHRAQKSILVGSYCVLSLGALAFALVVSPPARWWWQVPTDSHQVGVLIMCRFVIGTCGGFSIFLTVMTWSVTPNAEMVHLEIAKAVCRNTGIGMGPILSSMVGRAMHAASVPERAAAPAYVFALLWVVFAIFAWLFLPDCMELLHREKEEADSSEASSSHAESPIAQLPAEERRQVWFSCMGYGMERALVVSALETAMIFVFETEFQWTPSKAGYFVGATFLVGVPVMLAVVLRQGRFFTDIQLMKVAACVCALASIIVFPQFLNVFLPGSMAQACAVPSLLVAQSLIFTTGYLANGVVDGIAVQCVVPGTICTWENYGVAEMILQDSVARSVGPPIARGIIDRGGRTWYAVFQLAVSVVGCASCLKIASHVQRRRDWCGGH